MPTLSALTAWEMPISPASGNPSMPFDITGAGVLRLTMDGGSLEGSIDGPGLIRYRGSVVNERIRIDGAGRIVAE